MELEVSNRRSITAEVDGVHDRESTADAKGESEAASESHPIQGLHGPSLAVAAAWIAALFAHPSWLSVPFFCGFYLRKYEPN